MYSKRIGARGRSKRAGRALGRGKASAAAFTAMLAVGLAACGVADDEAEPLPPPPYGEEVRPNVDVWLETLELSSRELYAAREEVVAALEISAGERIADIGAGTGIYSLLFAAAVGERGVVYAVDIEPRFLSLVAQRVADADIDNVVAVLSREDDVTLPRGSADLAFVADTYHYFADPEAVTGSLRRALSEEGRLVVIDRNYDPATAADPSRDHIRFGKEELVAEIESFGFRLSREAVVEGLGDYFMLEFRKSPETGP